MENVTIGNQQASFLHWFGGIVDGDGCLTIRYRIQRKRFVQFTPSLIINNTSKKIIDECEKGLNELSIPYWLTVKPIQNQKTQYHLEISGIKRMARLLPYLRVRGKKEEANIIKKFIESRLSRAKCAPYNDEEINCVKHLYEIHCRQKPQRLYARLLEFKGNVN